MNLFKNKKILIYILILIVFVLILIFLKNKNKKPGNIEIKKIVRVESQTVTQKPIPEDCLMSDWGSKERCDQLIQSISSFEECVNAGFATANESECKTPNGKIFSKENNFEKIDLVGVVQDLGNLGCPCFILKTDNGKSRSVRYGLFLPEDNRKNIDVTNIKNGYRVRVVGVREKRPDSRAFVEILLDKIEIIKKGN